MTKRTPSVEAAIKHLSDHQDDVMEGCQTLVDYITQLEQSTPTYEAGLLSKIPVSDRIAAQILIIAKEERQALEAGASVCGIALEFEKLWKYLLLQKSTPTYAQGFREGLEAAAKCVDAFGGEKQKDNGLDRGVQDLFRARERIRAIPVPTPSGSQGWTYADTEMTFYAFRYGLGRMSYAVSTIAGYVRDNWNNLDSKHQELIHKEIKEAMNRDGAGEDIDRAQWQSVLDLPISAPQVKGVGDADALDEINKVAE